MRSLCIIVLALLSACAAEYTSDKGLDVNAIINDKEKMTPFVQCLVGKKECGPATAAAKTEFGDALQDACAKCNEIQKELARKFFRVFKKDYLAEYEALKQTYDSDNKLFPAFEKGIGV